MLKVTCRPVGVSQTLGYSWDMEDPWLTEAVLNNAAWCSAIAASHGVSVHWSKSSWFCELSMPPLYPNIVTLTSGVDLDEQINAIDSQLPVGWGIKDSYKELNLDGKGFAVAFEAHWYCLKPKRYGLGEKSPSIGVEAVTNQAELKRWATAWGEKSEIFKPPLLLDETVELVYLEKDGRVVSGLATNSSGNSIGISNSFGDPSDILACVASISEKNPMKGIVGYGSKDDVASLSRIGFLAIGDLQIWLRK